MTKQKVKYLSLFSFSLLTFNYSNASHLTKDEHPNSNIKPKISSVTLQNNGLVYLLPGESKGYTPNAFFEEDSSAAFSGERYQLDEFFLTLKDQYGNTIDDKNILDHTSIQLDPSWSQNAMNFTFLEACKRIQFESDEYGNIKIKQAPKHIDTLTTCEFKLKKKNRNSRDYLDHKSKLSFQLKLNYPFKIWATLPHSDSLPASRFARSIENLDHKSNEITFSIHKKDDLYSEALDLSSIYQLNLFPYLETLTITGYTITSFTNSFAFPKVPNLTKLIYADNKIHTLPQFAFDGLSHLEKIGLIGNHIWYIQERAFFNLSRLHEINLDNNIDYKPQGKSFLGLERIKSLSLKNCQIKDLPKGFFAGIHGLEHLNLKNNGIINISEDLLINNQDLFLRNPNLNIEF